MCFTLRFIMGNGCSLMKKTFVRVTTLVVYILIWSAVFVYIEKTGVPNAVTANRMLQEVKNNISRILGVNISEEYFGAVVRNISEAVKIKETPDWSYWHTVDFAVQALTTIGFGTMTPRTVTGQMTFILFALFGLPLTMATLKSTGELLLGFIKKLIIFFERRFLQKQETKNICIKSSIFSFFQFLSLQASVATLYVRFNRISYLEGIYASFVMLTTIGFGDYVFDFNSIQRENGATDASMSVFLLLTLPLFLIYLTVVSCFLNSIMAAMETLRKFECKRGISDANLEARDNPVQDTTTDLEMASKASLRSL